MAKKRDEGLAILNEQCEELTWQVSRMQEVDEENMHVIHSQAIELEDAKQQVTDAHRIIGRLQGQLSELQLLNEELEASIAAMQEMKFSYYNVEMFGQENDQDQDSYEEVTFPHSQPSLDLRSTGFSLTSIAASPFMADDIMAEVQALRRSTLGTCPMDMPPSFTEQQQRATKTHLTPVSTSGAQSSSVAQSTPLQFYPDSKGQDSKGQDPKGQDPKGQDPKGQDPKGQDPKGQDPKGQDPKGQDPTPKESKRKDSRGQDSKEKASKEQDSVAPASSQARSGAETKHASFTSPAVAEAKTKASPPATQAWLEAQIGSSPSLPQGSLAAQTAGETMVAVPAGPLAESLIQRTAAGPTAASQGPVVPDSDTAVAPTYVRPAHEDSLVQILLEDIAELQVQKPRTSSGCSSSSSSDSHVSDAASFYSVGSATPSSQQAGPQVILQSNRIPAPHRIATAAVGNSMHQATSIALKPAEPTPVHHIAATFKHHHEPHSKPDARSGDTTGRHQPNGPHAGVSSLRSSLDRLSEASLESARADSQTRKYFSAVPAHGPAGVLGFLNVLGMALDSHTSKAPVAAQRSSGVLGDLEAAARASLDLPLSESPTGYLSPVAEMPTHVHEQPAGHKTPPYYNANHDDGLRGSSSSESGQDAGNELEPASRIHQEEQVSAVTAARQRHSRYSAQTKYYGAITNNEGTDNESGKLSSSIAANHESTLTGNNIGPIVQIMRKTNSLESWQGPTAILVAGSEAYDATGPPSSSPMDPAIENECGNLGQSPQSADFTFTHMDGVSADSRSSQVLHTDSDLRRNKALHDDTDSRSSEELHDYADPRSAEYLYADTEPTSREALHDDGDPHNSQALHNVETRSSGSLHVDAEDRSSEALHYNADLSTSKASHNNMEPKSAETSYADAEPRSKLTHMVPELRSSEALHSDAGNMEPIVQSTSSQDSSAGTSVDADRNASIAGVSEALLSLSRPRSPSRLTTVDERAVLPTVLSTVSNKAQSRTGTNKVHPGRGGTEKSQVGSPGHAGAANKMVPKFTASGGSGLTVNTSGRHKPSAGKMTSSGEVSFYNVYPPREVKGVSPDGTPTRLTPTVSPRGSLDESLTNTPIVSKKDKINRSSISFSTSPKALLAPAKSPSTKAPSPAKAPLSPGSLSKQSSNRALHRTSSKDASSIDSSTAAKMETTSTKPVTKLAATQSTTMPNTGAPALTAPTRSSTARPMGPSAAEAASPVRKTTAVAFGSGSTRAVNDGESLTPVRIKVKDAEARSLNATPLPSSKKQNMHAEQDGSSSPLIPAGKVVPS